MKNKPKITIEIDSNSMAILMNGLPHILIPLEGFKGIHSWSQGNRFGIIFYCTGIQRECIYDTYEKWSQILKLIYEVNKKYDLF